MEKLYPRDMDIIYAPLVWAIRERTNCIAFTLRRTVLAIWPGFYIVSYTTCIWLHFSALLALIGLRHESAYVELFTAFIYNDGRLSIDRPVSFCFSGPLGMQWLHVPFLYGMSELAHIWRSSGVVPKSQCSTFDEAC
jgi:hypothetical protein